MSDDKIKLEWKRALRLYNKGGSLSKRIAFMIADDLESAGVTDADIDRLFPD